MMVQRKKGIYEKYIKRLLDIIASFVLLVILSPVLLIVALLVRVKLGSPVLFKQARPGMNEKIFFMYKFRSMTNATDADGKLLPDSERLTKFGKTLRKTSLDELPEIANIFKGDMSFVGPRPLSIYYLPHYYGPSKSRHDVRPGLTGLAQVNGRNTLDWDKRFEFDEQYVNNVSFLNDFKILISTVKKVAKTEGVSVRGTSKMLDYGPYRILNEEGKKHMKTQGMTYPEIGSYFWLEKQVGPAEEAGVFPWLPDVNDSTFTFSGRAAIDIALRDIISLEDSFTAYIPSYSCVSMLQSFLDHNIKTEFYDISFGSSGFEYDISAPRKGDVILIMNYFGFNTEAVHEEIRRLHERGVIVIEDITHSLLCDKAFSPYSDYVIAALRKWFAIPAGGWCGKANGILAEVPDIDSNYTVEEKLRGMQLKTDYIQGRIKEKEEFLKLQSKFDNDLIHVDRMLRIDGYSYAIMAGENIEEIRDKRRRNAGYLCSGLKNLLGSVMTFMEPDPGDTPLFFPVFLANDDRESLRASLINKGMYTPVHWPEVMGAKPGVRENELSLICDQRYNGNDMRAIVNAIQEWYGERYGS